MLYLEESSSTQENPVNVLVNLDHVEYVRFYSGVAEIRLHSGALVVVNNKNGSVNSMFANELGRRRDR